jgi:hypothetical protein
MFLSTPPAKVYKAPVVHCTYVPANETETLQGCQGIPLDDEFPNPWVPAIEDRPLLGERLRLLEICGGVKPDSEVGTRVCERQRDSNLLD